MGEEANMVRVRIRFEGHVQGVGFRPTLVKFATRKKCTGWVRNEADSTVVTAELQGERRAIDAVLRSLDSRFNDGVWHRGYVIAEEREVPLVPEEADMRVKRGV